MVPLISETPICSSRRTSHPLAKKCLYGTLRHTPMVARSIMRCLAASVPDTIAPAKSRMPNSKRLAAWVDTVLALWCCRDLFRVRPILRKGLRRPAWASAEVRNLNTRRRIWAGKIQDAKRLVARTYADKVGEVRLAQGVAKIGQFCEEASATWTLFLQAQEPERLPGPEGPPGTSRAFTRSRDVLRNGLVEPAKPSGRPRTDKQQ